MGLKKKKTSTTATNYIVQAEAAARIMAEVLDGLAPLRDEEGKRVLAKCGHCHEEVYLLPDKGPLPVAVPGQHSTWERGRPVWARGNRYICTSPNAPLSPYGWRYHEVPTDEVDALLMQLGGEGKPVSWYPPSELAAQAVHTTFTWAHQSQHAYGNAVDTKVAHSISAKMLADSVVLTFPDASTA